MRHGPEEEEERRTLHSVPKRLDGSCELVHRDREAVCLVVIRHELRAQGQ